MKTTVNKKLTWREKISYGVADMGFNFYWTNVATFLLIYYTDVFGISAAAAASIASAKLFSSPETLGISQIARVRSTEDAVRSSTMGQDYLPRHE